MESQSPPSHSGGPAAAAKGLALLGSGTSGPGCQPEAAQPPQAVTVIINDDDRDHDDSVGDDSP